MQILYGNQSGWLLVRVISKVHCGRVKLLSHENRSRHCRGNIFVNFQFGTEIYILKYSESHCTQVIAGKYRFHNHGGKSKGTTCVVDRDVTAYLVVDRVLRFPTEQYGCRYGGYPWFNDVKVICLGIFCYFTFRICCWDIFLSCEKRRQAIVSQIFI